LRTKASKERLRPALAPGNVEKAMSAPVTVIVAYDLRFYEKLPKLAPHNPGFRDLFANNPELAEATAKRNATLQGAYFIIAARALGLDCGPMSGFDNAKVDAAFFAGTPVKSNFICALGVGTTEKLFPRNPRLSFEEACRIV
jgi:3-hydroxypropanoate dehydrogenase